MRREVVRALLWSFLTTGILTALVVVGSRNLERFDAALVAYTFATLFAVFGLTLRYAIWLQRPSTAVYWKRGWQLFFRRERFLGNCAALGGARDGRVRRQRFHLAPRPPSRPHPHAAHVGLHHRGRDHVPARLRLALLRIDPGPDGLVSRLRLRLSDAVVPARVHRGIPRLSRAGLGVAARRPRRDARHAPSDAGRGRRGPAAVRRGLPPPDPALLGQHHGPAADGELHVAPRLRLRVSGADPRGDRHPHPAVAALRQVLPHLSKARAARRRVLQGRGGAGRGRGLRALRPADSPRRCTSKT